MKREDAIAHAGLAKRIHLARESHGKPAKARLKLHDILDRDFPSSGIITGPGFPKADVRVSISDVDTIVLLAIGDQHHTRKIFHHAIVGWLDGV
jgi:hypothetical protein